MSNALPVLKPDPSLVACLRCCRDAGVVASGAFGCPQDRVDVMVHIAERYCPHPRGPRHGSRERPAGWDRHPVVKDGAAPQIDAEERDRRVERAKAKRTERLRSMWNDLHGRPRLYWARGEVDAATEGKYVAAFVRLLPCGKCRTDARQRVARLPPDFSSPAAYFAWGWGWHDEINERLGKPRPTLAEALELHGYGPTRGGGGHDRPGVEPASIAS